MNIHRNNYFWRTWSTYLFLLGLGVTLAGLLHVASIARHERTNDELVLNAQVSLFASAAQTPLARGDVADLEALAAEVSANTGLRVTVIDTTGRVLVDTREDPADMDNHLNRPEVQLALARGEGDVERYSQTLNRNFLYQAIAVKQAGQTVGIVRLARAREDLNRGIASRRNTVIFESLAIFAVLSALSLIWVRRNTDTVELLTQTTEAIAGGDFERRVPESRALGMKRLVDAINHMARHSAKRLSILQADRNRLAAIFTGMVEGVVDVDQKQNIVHINEAAAKLLGLEPGKCIGKPVWQEIRNQKITTALDEAIRKHSVIKTQIDYLRGRDQLDIDLYVASLEDDDGQPIGGILVLHDVTELRNLERIRTDFVANASHELKTPITAIRGLSETVISDDSVDRDTLASFMERIHAQSIRLSQLVGDLMTISRLEADSGLESFTFINFTDLLSRAVATARAGAEFKQQTLLTEISEEKLEVYGDRQNLSQLVDNLIDNAIKYTPEGGSITVRLAPQGNELQLQVEDTGIGISPQYQERVFERFYRVDKARSQSLGGTGLGLSIVRNIAERHNGHIQVRSHLGKGSVFTFRMELAGSRGEQA